MSVLSFIRIESGSDGVHVLKLTKGLLFAKKTVNIDVTRLFCQQAVKCDVK